MNNIHEQKNQMIKKQKIAASSHSISDNHIPLVITTTH
jgi:hypothetical protein